MRLPRLLPGLWVCLVLTVNAACAGRTMHPQSPLLRTLLLMSDVVNMREECMRQSGQPCGLDRLDPGRLTRWGPLTRIGDQSAVFEDYRIELTAIQSRGFCVSAIPIRKDSTLSSIWKGSHIGTKLYPPPWTDRPSACGSKGEIR